MFAFRRGCVLAFSGNMHAVAASPACLPHGLSVVAFVAAEMLLFACGGLRATDGKALQSGIDQLLVMHIGASNGNANRDSRRVGKHRAFDTQLPTIGRVFPGLFPRLAALWFAPRPSFAIPSRCLRGRRTLPRPVARACGTHRVGPTLGSRHGSRFPIRTRGHCLPLATGA
jgi:hypothetical protein